MLLRAHILRLPMFLWLLALANPVLAHKASDSFMYLDTDSGQFRIDVALRDLALLVPLDTNRDGEVTGGEFRQHRGAVLNAIEAGITLSTGNSACELQGEQWGISQHSDGAYAATRYQVLCAGGQPPERLEYRLLFDQDSLHRGLIQISTGDESSLAVAGPDSQTVDLRPAGHAGLWHSFATFLQEGVVHLLIGLDHILFLLVLVLPASLTRNQPTTSPRLWLPSRAQVIELSAVVTAFTVAHSITLALAALKIVSLPIAWVETVIAASIVVAAVNVVWPVLGRRTWPLAFGFGLIHGFGFASVLSDLTSGTANLAVALAGFNVGVELGQLALLAICFPLLTLLAQATPLYQRALVPVILLGVVGVSLMWVWERIPAV
ncbi:HupE/UreJ family protein [Marinobacter alexandrii]|uniref:HupE/UreJ family protein n=1 Tax=Marinobacter alexandrii TaxID=2570351 RepID=UPI001FFFD7BA|nr:HupE/UreJ family protein [Marinobacter alexandrii]MCK2148349.1 HupE/UreJ family protein [Marinobacter alexandrii]